ncbi:MAG: response regulator [Psychrobium sp.]
MWTITCYASDTEMDFEEYLRSPTPTQSITEINALLSAKMLTPQSQLKGYLALARLYNTTAQPELAFKAANSALKYAKTNKLADGEAYANKLLGILHFYRDERLIAIEYYQKALVHFRTTKQHIQQAHLLNNMALANVAVNNFEVAIGQYEIAASLYKQYGEVIDELDVQFNIGILYNRLYQFDASLGIYKRLTDRFTALGEDERLSRLNIETGRTYRDIGELKLAEQYLKQAYQQVKKFDNDFHLAFAAELLAQVKIDLGFTDEGRKLANEAIELAERGQNIDAMIGGYIALASASYLSGNYDDALTMLSRADSIIEPENNPQRPETIWSIKSLIFAAQGKADKALKAQQQFAYLKGLRTSEHANTRLARFQAELDTDNLSRKVKDLTQKEQLQALEFEKTQQKYLLWMGTGIFAVVIMFFMYRGRAQTKLKQNLAQKVKLRTEELELLMEEVQEANAIKNQFLANMSHELRTPLTAVIGQAEAIIAGDVEPEFVHKEVEIIYSNSTHLLTLLNDLLDLSRIEANKLELELKQHDIHKLIDKVSSFFNEQAHKKGLEFVIDNQLSTPFVMMVDELRLKQILINLCSNAIKFTYQGKVSIEIKSDSHCVVFKVIDTGIGLDEQQLAQIFNRFTQGDSSISRRFGGSGLGLCLSQQLALMMGGNIKVTSELGLGSEFEFTLPVSDQPCYVQQDLPAVTQRLDPNLSLNGLVLLADDHDDNRRLTERLLRVLGLNVVTAANGYQAIKQYNLRKPDLVLLDIQMPEMDGIEAFKALRQQGARVPIIALTANAMNHEIEHYMRLGFDDYISKPIVRNYFVQVLARNLQQSVSNAQTQELAAVDTSDISSDFKASFNKERENFAELLSTFDYTDLAKAAHRFSGAAAMFQFTQLAVLAADIEKAIKQQQQLKAKELTQELINQLSNEQ